jgi:hypothetical protein
MRPTKTDLLFLLWFPIVATAAVFGFWMIVRFPHGRTLADAYFAVFNIVALIFCASVCIAGYFFRPRGMRLTATTATAVLAYAAFLFYRVQDRKSWGERSLTVQVLDFDHHPVIGMPLNVLPKDAAIGAQQPPGAGNYHSMVETDQNGEATVLINKFLGVTGEVNWKRKPEYRSVSFDIFTKDDKSTWINYSWENAHERYGELQTIVPIDLSGKSARVVVYLPSVHSIDADPYLEGKGAALPPPIKPWDMQKLNELKARHQGVVVLLKDHRSLKSDGTPLVVDLAQPYLFAGTRSGPARFAPGSDPVSIQAWATYVVKPRSASEVASWKVKISVPNGGITRGYGEFEFNAPLDGYSPSVEMGPSDYNGPSQRDGYREAYYLKFADGRYAQLDILVGVRNSPEIDFEVLLNTTPGDTFFGSDPSGDVVVAKPQ